MKAEGKPCQFGGSEKKQLIKGVCVCECASVCESASVCMNLYVHVNVCECVSVCVYMLG